MALPDTNTLDIPSRGLPAEYVYSTTSGPAVDTGTLDIPGRGLPASYIYVTTVGGGTVTDSITADAVIGTSQSDTLTTDSTIKKTQPGSFSADAFVQWTSGTKTITADATVEAARADSIAADAIIEQASGTKTITADAIVEVARADSIDADAIIKRTSGTKTITADAIVEATRTDSIDADAIIKRASGTKTITADADIATAAQEKTGDITADATIQTTTPDSITADAAVLKTVTVTGPDTAYLTLNGTSSYVDCDSDASLDNLTAGAFTVDLWARSHTGINSLDALVSKHVGDKQFGFMFGLYGDGDACCPYCEINGSQNGVFLANEGIAENTWHHITFCLNASGVPYAAIDGVWCTYYYQETLVSPSDDSDNTLRFGYEETGRPGFFDGDISWVRISSGVRYTIGDNFSPPDRDTAPGVDGSTIELWALDEGAGTAAAASVNSPENDGTIVDGAWYTVQGAPTIDAIIQATTSDNVTADAVILRTVVDSVDAEAVILAGLISGITGDAAIAKAASSSITADAIVEAASGTKTITADAILQAAQSKSITADADIGRIGRCTWVSPADGVNMSTLPVLVFIMPDSVGNMHFHLQLDTVDTFDSGDLREFKTNHSLTGWEYYDGDSWEPFPAAGVPNTYSGNQARYTVQTDLTLTTWYRRVRGGA